ncbi:Protein export cytoplasm protein SecA2 ATPase RNA helicase [Staphylococcus aureus]|nr:Protein export cytoplasm protein SecA2 ATPase RNA helicase [Staphylococcus aureus]
MILWIMSIKKGKKRNIYEHDIIYTTNGRLGFDYLIDNLADSAEGKFLPQLNYGIIDEVDSIILDAAQTPLVFRAHQDYNQIYFIL